MKWMLLKHQHELKFPGLVLTEDSPPQALVLNSWSLFCETVLGSSAAVLEELNNWQHAMRIPNLVPHPVISDCSLVLVENVISKLPALATCCHSATANTDSLPRTISQKISFGNKLLLVTMFYRNRKVTTAHGELALPKGVCVCCPSLRLC